MATSSSQSLLLQGREFTVPVPWGVIAGREWGDPAGHPWIALHGWLDNCGTFDHIAPLFPRGHRIIAIDYPGNGKSSHYPLGNGYFFAESLVHLRRVSQHFNLRTFGLMGHSMGGAMSVLFAATHPEYVTGLIAFDILKPVGRKTADVLKATRKAVEEALAIEEKIKSGREPVYSMEMARERLRQGMFFHGENPITEEGLDTMLKRGVKPAGGEEGNVVYSRDLKHRATRLIGFHDEHLMEFVKSVKCPMLVVRASIRPTYTTEADVEATLAVYRDSNPLFEDHEAEGNHHVHLNNPKLVMEKVKPFLEKHEAVWIDRSKH